MRLVIALFFCLSLLSIESENLESVEKEDKEWYEKIDAILVSRKRKQTEPSPDPTPVVKSVGRFTVTEIKYGVDKIRRFLEDDFSKSDDKNPQLITISDLGFVCSECKQIFRSKHSGHEHIKRIHLKVTYLCDHCGRILTSFQGILGHRKCTKK